MNSLQPTANSTQAEQVFQRLHDDIIRCKLAPGTKAQHCRMHHGRITSRTSVFFTVKDTSHGLYGGKNGPTGTMSSALLPGLIKPVVEHRRQGLIETAAEQYGRIQPLINFENHPCGQRACKTSMMEGGVIKSDYVCHPLQP